MIVNNSGNWSITGPMWYNGFMDALNVLSFMIGLENLELNVTSQDLSEESNRILEQLQAHFSRENAHLSLQDQHLLEQDRHFLEQDRRLDRIEKLILGIMAFHDRKENKNNG